MFLISRGRGVIRVPILIQSRDGTSLGENVLSVPGKDRKVTQTMRKT